jgi:hypothetical protein
MKTRIFQTLLILFTIVITNPIRAQIKGSGEITKQSFQIKEFNTVEAGGALDIVLMNSDEYSLVIETNENLHNYITYEIKNNTLRFKLNKIKKYDELTIYITAPIFNKINVSGACEVKSPEILKGQTLKLNVSGAAEAKLLLEYENIIAKASGASEIKLSGTVNSFVAQASGASEIRANALVSQIAVVSGSGASESFVNAKNSLTYSISGGSSVRYVDKPKTIIIENSNKTEKVIVVDKPVTTTYYQDNDTTTVTVGSLNVEVVEGDTTKVSVGSRTLIVSDDGNVSWERNRKPKFNGHWGGVELGVNGFVTPDFNTNWAPEYDYLNLRYEKSIAVNLNIYEQNIALNKSKNIGLITGLGLAWNNYTFSGSTFLTPDSANLKGYYMEGVSVRKSKLTAMYLTVPVIFEVQTKHNKRSKRFHFSAGVLASLRLSTHTKIYFNEPDEIYSLRDPKTNLLLDQDFRTPNSNSRNIVKNFNSFYLQPFKFDATVRAGYGIINLFATYSLNTLFQKNRGPELYAWTAGITIVGW